MMAHEKIYKNIQAPLRAQSHQNIIPETATDFQLSALSGKFWIMNTVAGSLESCHHLSLSSCLLLRIFKVQNHYRAPFWQKNAQKTGLASGWVLQSKGIPSQKSVLINTSRKCTHWKKNQNKATKLNQLSMPKRQSLRKQKRAKQGK